MQMIEIMLRVTKQSGKLMLKTIGNILSSFGALWRVGRVFDEEGIGCAMHDSWL
jgi:hypothetical protein